MKTVVQLSRAMAGRNTARRQCRQIYGRAQVKMRKTQRDSGSRVVEFKKNTVEGHAKLDPFTKAWLDKVVIPILVKKLRQEWNEEKTA